MGDSIEGRPEPGRTGPATCLLPKGSEVHALAKVPSSDALDVAVRAPSCATPVWIWIIDVKWKNVEWWALRDKLPDVRATLASPLRTPTLIGATTTPAVAPPTTPGAPASVSVVDTKGLEHPWNKAIPDAWRAPSLQTATLVATVKQTPEIVETCSYIPMGAVYRVRPGYAITLSLNDRSRVVARTTLRGEAPAACPGSVSVKIGGGNDPWQIGGEPGPERLVAWLRPFALGPR